MNERLKVILKGLWLIAGVAAVTIPVFVPSVTVGHITGNPIMMALVSMFLLSLPGSLLVFPLSYVIDAGFGFTLRPIEFLYLNVWMLFLIGAVQWFWLVPRMFHRGVIVEAIDLSLTEGDVGSFDVNGATPLERVLRNGDTPQPAP